MTRRATSRIAPAMRHGIVGAVAVLQIGAAPAQGAGAARDVFALLRADDLRLAVVAERLAIANAALCRDKQPRLGVVLHALDQYQAEARGGAKAAFGFEAPVSIEAVVPDSAAARAGVEQDEGVVAINGTPLANPLPGAKASTASRDSAEALLAAQPTDRPITLRLRHHGMERDAVVMPVIGCRIRYEVHELDEAAADGRIVQIGASYLDRFDDAALGVIVAHEFSHMILRHRARLDAAGVSYGILAEFGRNARLARQSESEADRLSPYLLYNAGLDPLGPGRFWRGSGRALSGGLFRSAAYPSARARAQALDAEAAKIPAGAPRPFAPPLLALADQPMR